MQFCSKKIFWSFKEIVLFSLNNLNSNIHIRCLAFLLTLQPCANILPLKYAMIVNISCCWATGKFTIIPMLTKRSDLSAMSIF